MVKKQPLAKRVITKYYPSHVREFYPHGGAKDWNWACSICELVYEKQTDAQACCYQEKYDRGWAWREPSEHIKPKNKPIVEGLPGGDRTE